VTARVAGRRQEALASKGAGGSACRLDGAQLAELRAALEGGPGAHGWDQDQRWTLARAAALAVRLFGVCYTLRGMSFLLHRIGYSPQVVHLPGYAPDLNAVEGAWASMKSSLGNHAACTLDELEAMVRTRLRKIQRRPDLIDAFLGQTGLTLETQPP
jgi:transposase